MSSKSSRQGLSSTGRSYEIYLTHDNEATVHFAFEIACEKTTGKKATAKIARRSMAIGKGKKGRELTMRLRP